jgi:hypothetical protein
MLEHEIYEQFIKYRAEIVTDVLAKLGTPPHMLPLIAVFLLGVYAKSLGMTEEDLRELFEAAIDDFFRQPTSESKVIPLKKV